MNKESKRWPGEVDEGHPELFNTIPLQQKVLKTGQLSEDKVKQFFNEGFLVLDSFFKPDELNPAIDRINASVDELAHKLYSAGKIKDLYVDYGFQSRLTMLEKDFPGAMILLHKTASIPKEFQDLWSNERLLNLAEQLIGTADLAGNPVWNLRTKIPRAEAGVVPWHQDCGYLDNDSYEVFQLTAWIPLLDADESNGCMQVLRYGQKTGKIARHVGCWGDTWYVMLVEEEIKNTLGCDLDKDVVTCPVPFGGVLLFSNVLPHRSLDNVSEKIRWSLDLRWQDANKPVGFYGLKDGIKLRSSNNSDFKIDWETFNSVSRHEKQVEAMQADDSEFDTTIPGPWMNKWEIIHHNRHTKALEKRSEGSSWHNLIVG